MSINRLNIYAVITFVLLIVTISGTGKAMAFAPNPGTVMFKNFWGENLLNSLEPESQSEAPELKSVTRARLYSAAATTIPLALSQLNSRGYRFSEQSVTSILMIAAGIIAGPSAGSIYADDWHMAKRSIRIRSVSAIVISSGHLVRENELSESLGSSLLIAGGILLVSHALYDIFFLSSHSVQYYNTIIRLEAGISFQEKIPVEWGAPAPDLSQSAVQQLPNLSLRLYF